jgi:hypothetical protein
MKQLRPPAKDLMAKKIHGNQLKGRVRLRRAEMSDGQTPKWPSIGVC